MDIQALRFRQNFADASKKISKRKISMENKLKCGIVTFHSSHNYGSVLQAYAMVKVMQRLGLDAELIDFRHPRTTDMYEWRLWSPYKNWKWNLRELVLRGLLSFGKKREQVFSDFIENVLVKSKRVKDKNDIPDIYDVLVCGSDQIWNPFASGCNDPIYYLDFGSTTCKFSYAASSGSVRFGDSNIDLFRNYLSKLKSIGVREQFMQKYIKEVFGFASVVNPDPTFLLSAAEWSEIEIPYDGLPDKYLLIYTIQRQKETIDFANKVAKIMQLPKVQICNDRDLRTLAHKHVDYRLMDVSPQQFLWLFHHASFVVTNTFHGNMFSVIFRRKFIHYAINPGDNRITTLHKTIGLNKSNMFYLEDSIESVENQQSYNKDIEQKIASYIQGGIEFIHSNLTE